MGDGMLVEFSSVVNAVACAVDIQHGMRERNTGVPDDKIIAFRIGIHLGDIMVEGNDIYGDGVNVASRIEAVARLGGIAVSAAVRDNVGNRLDVAFDDLGEQRLKNIDRLIRIYNVALAGGSCGPSHALTVALNASPQEEKPSIALLPFNNMSGDPGVSRASSCRKKGIQGLERCSGQNGGALRSDSLVNWPANFHQEP